jgi:hypothetical protein
MGFKSGLCIFLSIIVLSIGAYALSGGMRSERYKLQHYKQAACTVTQGTVYHYSGSDKRAHWRARWVVLFKAANFSRIPIVFSESLAGVALIKSTGLKYVAQFQV